jgi:D-threo-aldose 1-dehydrogenase
MSDSERRIFLQGLGTAALASWALPTWAEDRAGLVLPTRGPVRAKGLPENDPSSRFRPPTRLGLGGVAIGNGFAIATDQQCDEAMAAAWTSGVRYFDTSPWYGLGLSERRFGIFLKDQPRDEFVLSTKIGRVFEAAPAPPNTPWKSPSPFKYHYDYTAAGVRRSLEDSLQRLGLSRIDIVFVHDLSPDNEDLGDRWTEQFDVAKKGAFVELSKMRKEGLIKAWGLGVNRPLPALRALEVADPDIFLLATQYSLIEHQEAVEKTFPALQKRGISVVVGAPLNAGYLAGRDRYDYKGTVPDGAPEKRKQLQSIANRHGIDLRTVALQFCAAPKVVAAVIPGARTAEQARSNGLSMRVAIPPELWDDLRQASLIHEAAAVPGKPDAGKPAPPVTGTAAPAGAKKQ